MSSPHRRGAEEPFRPKSSSSYKSEHRTGSGHPDHIPNQYDYDRVVPQAHNSSSRTLHKEKSVPNDKAWLEHQRRAAALGHEADREPSVQEHNGPHASTSIPATSGGKPVQLNQYDYDKPHAEFGYHLQEFYRKNQFRGGADFLRNAAAATATTTSSGVPVVSKLDLEEKQIRDVRMSGIYVSSDSESDSEEEDEEKREKYRVRMEKIATRSNLPLDKSESKLGFFENMGLTTQGTKHGKQFLLLLQKIIS